MNLLPAPTNLLALLVCVACSPAADVNSDLAWRNDPRQWHQQAARIIDHRFTTFDVLRGFAADAKKAGVSALMLVQVQKTAACPGPWYNGLQLCDHINGSMPAADGTLAEWRALVEEVKPMRLMWWLNAAFWSVQGQVWHQADAEKDSDVGRWFSWNATADEACRYGDNVDGAQGSYRSAKTTGNGSGLASWCSPTYADYMVDAMANSWTRNLGIDGYTLDCGARYSKGNCGSAGMLQCPDGDGQLGWARIVGRVRALQPQVVHSGENYNSWEEVMRVDADMGAKRGPQEPQFHAATQQAVELGDASELEGVASTSGADAATVLCYLHPHYDGRQPGGCPTLYYRDNTATIADARRHQMWVALEAGSGILPQHDFDPGSECRTSGAPPVFNGCWHNGDGAWWNVTNDPRPPAPPAEAAAVGGGSDAESPLWAFAKYRALNRLALRTKLPHTVGARRADVGTGGGSQHVAVVASPSSNYTEYQHANCYTGHGGTDIGRAYANMSAVQCMERCSSDRACDCVTYSTGGAKHGDCWERASCVPAAFERNAKTVNFTVFVKSNAPAPVPPIPPQPSAVGGALVYLKHDSMGPYGDACIMVFNPAPRAANITIDLSMLPASLLNGTVTPYDLLGPDQDAHASPPPPLVPPLAKQWTVALGPTDMKFFGGFSLGVFAPRLGKKASCKSGYSRACSRATLQGCFLECLNDARCENVLVQYEEVPWLGAPPALNATLLGPVQDPTAACRPGNATLIHKLPGARPCAHRWNGGAGHSAPLVAPSPAGLRLLEEPECPTSYK